MKPLSNTAITEEKPVSNIAITAKKQCQILLPLRKKAVSHIGITEEKNRFKYCYH